MKDTQCALSAHTTPPHSCFLCNHPEYKLGSFEIDKWKNKIDLFNRVVKVPKHVKPHHHSHRYSVDHYSFLFCFWSSSLRWHVSNCWAWKGGLKWRLPPHAPILWGCKSNIPFTSRQLDRGESWIYNERKPSKSQTRSLIKRKSGEKKPLFPLLVLRVKREK